MDQPRRTRNGAWDIVLVRPGPSTAQSDRCAKLLLMWLAAIAAAVALFVFAGYVWGSVATVVLLAVGCWFTCYYFNAAASVPPLLPEAALRVPVALGQPQMMINGGGLSQDDIDAIAACKYHQKAGTAAEQCAVCINVVRDGETVRRLPACGYAFHVSCVDGWLRNHATCPMCRADVKIAGNQLQTEAAV